MPSSALPQSKLSGDVYASLGRPLGRSARKLDGLLNASASAFKLTSAPPPLQTSKLAPPRWAEFLNALQRLQVVRGFIASFTYALSCLNEQYRCSVFAKFYCTFWEHFTLPIFWQWRSTLYMFKFHKVGISKYSST